MFGVNDGLVSNLALTMGVAGARPDPDVILLSGLAGLLAGAFSMGAGEYVSMRVQCEVGERTLAAHRLNTPCGPRRDQRESEASYRQRDFSPQLSERTSAELNVNSALATRAHLGSPIGREVDALGSPWAAAASSFGTFTLGAAMPLLPFLAVSRPAAFLLSTVLSLTNLAAIGTISSLFAGRPA